MSAEIVNFTGTGTNDWDARPATRGVVTVQGDANDFTWKLRASLDGGTTWSDVPDDAGDTSFTGFASKEIGAAPAPKLRVEITAMGTATSINALLDFD